MHIWVVTFALKVTADDYASRAVNLAPAFAGWPGLLSKWWLSDTATNTYGGVYLFDTRENADRSRHTELFGEMLRTPALDDVRIREYDVLEAPTAITAVVPFQAARQAS